MLDIKFIRENVDLIKAGAKKKHIEVDIDRLIEVDDTRRSLLSDIETMRARQNEVSKIIVSTQDDQQKNTLLGEMKTLKENLQGKEKELESVNHEWQLLMVQVPNIPDVSVPEGESDADNQEIKTWGEQKQFSFEAKSHIDIMQTLGMVDFERGTKVAGFRGYFLKNDGALLSFAIWRYAQDFFVKKGMSPMVVPSLVRRVNFLGTGYIPQGEEDLYQTQDGDFLAGTAEVATMGYHMGDVVDIGELPIKFLSFSPCFRREAGSHGKDTKGLIRVHEFYKWEQVILCEASHQESVKWHEWLNRNTEEFIESLEIPYRTVLNCGGDIGLGQVKKYDVELWVPGEKTYREIASASYFHDFQTRRLNIRYRDADGKMRYAHSLNATAIPTPRILVSLIENYQQEDGSVIIPELLRPYMGKDVIQK
ncbi:serine--tRNA ligase [Candidatus Kaiserbacteria bacterium CG10_big_fil_rev_8_21_14_0_10_45_20]|uniref:Serine--tRNA ligase n=1 Tax=Candidatus Kaiserbacteria bacterium CG10_big_fil_rev_8_21_14_0_10_45_20 TaxID=1974607 RepID=A0A2H0UFA7_9BACT|nr:MAG: serine--tRNA ligase [Candidatus Kaiserbacteria bacterium CG10_big_fil_rev_8_21_14_0_10_45_20]